MAILRTIGILAYASLYLWLTFKQATLVEIPKKLSWSGDEGVWSVPLGQGPVSPRYIVFPDGDGKFILHAIEQLCSEGAGSVNVTYWMSGDRTATNHACDGRTATVSIPPVSEDVPEAPEALRVAIQNAQSAPEEPEDDGPMQYALEGSGP